MKPGPIPQTTEQRFWRFVRLGRGGGCWGWMGALSHGYAVMRISTPVRRQAKAARVSWEIHSGPIPEGKIICHRCDNPKCVNPAHLYLGTHTENMRDMVDRGRSTRGKRHPMVKLVASQVRAIRKDTRLCREIAADYGINPSHVGLIRSRKTWRWLP